MKILKRCSTKIYCYAVYDDMIPFVWYTWCIIVKAKNREEALEQVKSYVKNMSGYEDLKNPRFCIVENDIETSIHAFHCSADVKETNNCFSKEFIYEKKVSKFRGLPIYKRQFFISFSQPTIQEERE